MLKDKNPIFQAASQFNLLEMIKVFLTLVGGGAFGNEPDWIYRVITKSDSKI